MNVIPNEKAFSFWLSPFQKLRKDPVLQVANALFAGFSENVINIEIGKFNLTCNWQDPDKR